MRKAVVSILAVLAISAPAVADPSSDKAIRDAVQVTKTVLPQEATREKMPLLLLAIVAAAADGRNAMRARISARATE